MASTSQSRWSAIAVMQLETAPADLVTSARARMADDLSWIIQAYRHMEVGHPDTRKFAGTLERAAPNIPTFIGHPGMSGNTNDVGRTIRGYVVRPRNIRRVLPDW